MALALAVGCGGKSNQAANSNSTPSATTTASGGSTAGTGTTTAGATTGSGVEDCVAAGIDPAQMREGTCTHGGITWVIVNETHPLKLKTLSATLTGIGTDKVLASAGGTANANGKFVVASVRITNKLETAQVFDAAGSQQAELRLAGGNFKEAGSAEHADANSCLKRAAHLRSGASETCDVIFDVPDSAIADLGKHGSGDLYLVDFGADLSGSLVPQTIGQIRLYH